MRRHFESQAGITLLEVMSVVVIFGVVASMAVPRFQMAVERLRFRSANRDILNALRLARSQAITEKTPFGVHFDFWGGTVTIFEDSIVDVTSPYVFDENDPVFRTIDLPDEIEYLMTDVENNVITFNPNGAAAFTGQGNISCHGYSPSGGLLESFHNVLPATGRIRSYDTYEEWALAHGGLDRA
jgi:prepilin-type N-terminal cleavage/methylation domain-containing protein